MLLFGHRLIDTQKFYHVVDIDAIQNTPPNSCIYLEFSEKNLDIIHHLNSNAIAFALGVQNITELIYANALDSSYIVVSQELVRDAQNIAESYLFDAKILLHSDDENDIEAMALLGVDGILFSNAIIKINS